MEIENKVGFFEEGAPKNFSMARLLSFLISAVPLGIWTSANIVKLVMLMQAQATNLSDVTLVPMPESVLLLVTGGLGLKLAQKILGEKKPAEVK